MSLSRRQRRKNARINNTLLLILIGVMVLTIPVFVVNMIRVRNVETGKGETIEETEKIDNEFSNAHYSIGYNATDISKEYFRQLDEAVSAGTDQSAIAQALVKCFVTEYYTWTNKDGNYDIGGMQYIFSDRRSDFEKYTRYGFYADLDLYLTQYDRSQLIQVKDVTVDSCEQTESFTPQGSEVSYNCWKVNASWTYEEGTSMNTYDIQSSAEFLVVDHDGRLEIAAIDRPEEVVEDVYTEW